MADANDSTSRNTVPEPDAELIVLGFELQAAWHRELELDRLYADHEAEGGTEAVENAGTEAIVDRIDALEPTTINGLVVKAQSLAWRNSGDLSGDPIARDLLAIHGVALPRYDLEARRWSWPAA